MMFALYIFVWACALLSALASPILVVLEFMLWRQDRDALQHGLAVIVNLAATVFAWWWILTGGAS